MSKECLQIFRNLSLLLKQQGRVLSCLNALEVYFKPQRNAVYERYLFNSYIQGQDELTDAFFNHLRKLTSLFNFRTLTNELIYEQLMIGVRDNDLKGRLFQAITLQKAIEMSKSDEITKQ